MFPEMPDTHTHMRVQFKRGYIKRVSDLDDSLDVGSWEQEAGGWGGHPSQAGVS